jgi:hypothetical protein
MSHVKLQSCETKAQSLARIFRTWSLAYFADRLMVFEVLARGQGNDDGPLPAVGYLSPSGKTVVEFQMLSSKRTARFVRQMICRCDFGLNTT